MAICMNTRIRYVHLFSPLFRVVLMVGVFAVGGLSPTYGQLGSGVVLDRDSLNFNGHHLVGRDAMHQIEMVGNRFKIAGAKGWGEQGWFDYDFQVTEPGWYEVYATISGGYKNVEYIIDPTLYDEHKGGARLYATGQGFDHGVDRVGNVWLGQGAHTLRVQQYFWTGFPPITRLVIKRSPDNLAGRIHAALGATTNVFRKGHCSELMNRFRGYARDGW